MALNFDDIGKMVAKIGNKTLYINDKPIRDGFSSYETKGDQTVEQIPDKDTERSVLYITAPSGSASTAPFRTADSLPGTSEGMSA